MSLQALKNIINLQRPLHARKQDPGMPSSHASSLAYLAVYLAIAWHPKQPALASTGLVVAALLVSIYQLLFSKLQFQTVFLAYSCCNMQ